MDTDHSRAVTPDDFHSIISISIDGFLLVDLNGNILETNDSYCRMVGYSRDELLNLQLPAIDAIDNKDDVARRFELIILSGSLRFETQHRHKDGTVIDVEVSANYSAAHGGSIFSFIRDISSQKHIREIMAARLRLIEFSLTHSLDELLRQTLDEAEALTGSCIGFYHFKDPDSQILTLHAWSTKTATMFCKAEGTGSHYPVSQAGVWVDCIRERRPVIHNDYASLPHKKGLPDGHAAVVRELVVPIFRQDKIVAIMGIGNKATDYTQQDVEIISKLADLAWDVAERKQAEETLEESEKRFRSYFELPLIGIAITSPGKGWLHVNDRLCEDLGYPREELLQLSWPEITHPEDLGADLENFNHVVSGQSDGYSMEKRFIRKDGQTMHADISARCIRKASGEIESFVALVQNITERKRAEIALQHQQSMLARTESITHIGSWELDVATGAVTWSDELFHITQLNPADGTPSVKEQSKIYNPEDMKELLRVIELAVSDGTPYEIESRIIRPNGDIRICLARGFAERGPEGKVTRLFGSIQDITERKRTEEALKKSNEKFLGLVTNIPGHVAFVNAHTLQYEYVNNQYVKSFGIAPENIIGKHVKDIIGEANFQFALKYIEEVRAGRSVSYETTFDLITGKRWIEVTYNPIFDADGHVSSIVVLSYDITERKRYEEEKQLLEQQFQQAQKLESLGVLAGGIAHDFNNILAIIIGHCSLAEMNPDRALDHIPIIGKAADRAAGLCRQMLAYAGKGMFSMAQVNIAALVDEMVQMLKATINQNIVIQPDLLTDIPAIKGDASQLRQIVMNLIINASEAIGDVQGVINISLTKRAITAGQPAADHLGKTIMPGWYACLEIADTGCGMDDETGRRIFEPFYTTKFTGRGLGMSAVLGIITAHKGALQLASHPGQGTTFTIYLPIETGEPVGDESNELRVSTPWQGSGTVLLVEDEVQVKLVAKAMLEALGLNVIEASNGQEALDLYQQNASDISLVLTDIGMPVMDGYALFRELKMLKPDLPIIISSGFGDTVVTSKIRSEEIAGLVSKPYRLDQMREVVRVCEKKRQTNHRNTNELQAAS